MKKRIGALLLVLMLSVLLCACAKKEVAPLNDIYTRIKGEVTLTDMVELSDVSDLDRFYGISAEDVSEFAGGINSSGVEQEEIVLVKAVNKDAAKRINDALVARHSSKLSETKTYNPEQYAMLEKCTVDVDDLYISMILSPNASAIKKLYKDAIGAQYVEIKE